MKNLNSNYEMDERTINEFIRVLIPEKNNIFIEANFSESKDEIILELEVENKKQTYSYKNYLDKIEDEKIIILKVSLLKFFEKSYPWGGLIGVRPTKVVKKLLNANFSYDEIQNILENLYLVSKEKSELLINVFKKELEYLNPNPEFINLYIGIPFCPSKCKYCSFASYEIQSPVGVRFYKKFVETLLHEIKLAGELIRNRNLKVESIYIGGGTPSTLTEEDLEKVLQSVEENIPKKNLKEFTFEAGREDTITDEKLIIAKKFGVDRMSLNPQTFNLKTLSNMNRRFDLENFERIYQKMKELGFIINMDIILGLPNESEKDILETLEKLEKYDIENLTVHSLALKKASDLFKEEDKKLSDSIDRKKIEDKISEITKNKNMFPYYLYRQKNSVDWGENVGYAKIGFESIFNIEMIEENQSTLGLGGGAITKKIVKSCEREEITRVVNPKDPATYIAEMEKRFEDKIKLFEEKNEKQ